jgi:hypothetical protein
MADIAALIAALDVIQCEPINQREISSSRLRKFFYGGGLVIPAI